MNNKPKVIVSENIFAEVVSHLAHISEEAIRLRGRFYLAVSGGHSPVPLFERLAKENLPWKDFYIFWTDERNVSRSDVESNFRVASELWLSRVPIPQSQIFPYRTELNVPELIASDYEKTLRATFGTTVDQIPSFDLILLGMGSDGHTASLFNTEDNERHRLVLSPWVEKLQDFRYSLSPRILNNARRGFIIAIGKEKSPMVAEILLTLRLNPKYPIEMIHPLEELTWFLDSAGASDYQGAKI